MHKFITENAQQTRELGKLLAEELQGGEVLCLDGELGAGKTTFTQGLLQGLGIKGPYTSPTFVIMKEYSRGTWSVECGTPLCDTRSTLCAVYHIDAYRIGSDDLLALGWKEIMADTQSIAIVEWSNRVKKILPKRVLKITFSWLDKNRRQITFV